MKTYKCLKTEVFPNFYQRFPIVDRLNIGRGQQNDVVLTELSVSVHHATIWTQGEDVWIRDEKSTNGTTVNNMLLDQPLMLRPDDCISVGYIRMLFCEETEFRPRHVIDMDAADFRVPEDWGKCEDAAIRFPGDRRRIEALCELAFRGTKIGGDTVSSVSEILTALVSANPGSEGKHLELRRRAAQDGFEFTLLDPSGKAFPDMWKTLAMSDPNAENPKFHIPKGIDAVEYDKRKNLLVFRKNRESVEKTSGNLPVLKEGEQRQIAVRYFRRMCTESSFPVDVAVGEGTPFSADPLPSVRALPGRPSLAEIVPVFPGCVCSPGSARVDWSDEPILCRFWVTPLGTGSRKGVVQIAKSGKSVPAIEIPFAVGKKGAGFKCLLAAVWLPAVLMLPALLELSPSREIPAVLSSLLPSLQEIGGPWILALSLGILLAAASVVLFWRAHPRKSETLAKRLPGEEN